MKKIAIIGASYLQQPLIERAKEMGLETHVFAWKSGDIGEKTADYFYPISIVEKEVILDKCRQIRIDGICSIASDLAAITVNYVAHAMQLIGNSPECTRVSTNKHDMRECFQRHNDPSPKSILVESADQLQEIELAYPIIVKPVDRSGSRGITKLCDKEGLKEAIEAAKEQGFEKCALVEEFAAGQEYSVEYISWKGKHIFLAMTKKYTTGAPHFVETAHLEPALVEDVELKKVKQIVEHALGSLGIEYGASHSELKISDEGDIQLIEIGARMGGDLIGSSLVQLSTGIDFVENVIRVSLGEEPFVHKTEECASAVRFIFGREDIEVLEKIKREHPRYLVEEDVHDLIEKEVADSSMRFGYYLLKAETAEELLPYLPE